MRKRGFTIIELLVAIGLLISMIAVLGKMIRSVDLIWRDAELTRIASDELSNHLQVLTLLAPDDVESQLDDLAPSAMCLERLPDAKLDHKVSSDELGKRISLSLSWQHSAGNATRRVQLSGWLSEVKTREPSNE